LGSFTQHNIILSSLPQIAIRKDRRVPFEQFEACFTTNYSKLFYDLAYFQTVKRFHLIYGLVHAITEDQALLNGVLELGQKLVVDALLCPML